MTVPDPTAPTAGDVLARAMCDAIVETPLDEPCEGCKVQAAAVVAAVRAMSVETLAELRPDLRVEQYGSPGWQRSRLVGPWQEDPS